MASIRAWFMAKFTNAGTGETSAEAEPPRSTQGEIEAEPLNLQVSVPDERMAPWESQAAQYPATGPPGISYFRGELSPESFVDCLLFRDENGQLVGILNRYPKAFLPHEREGDQNIWVHPGHRRQGIGSALITESYLRWGPNPNADDLRLTESGVRLLEGMEAKRSIVGYVLAAPPEVVYSEWWDPERMREWMCVGATLPTHIEIDPRVGGTYRIDIDDAGHAFSITGRYLVLDPPSALAFTWRCTTWEPSVPESVVRVQLEPHDGGRTIMTIRHGRLPAELREDYKATWGRIAERLSRLLQ